MKACEKAPVDGSTSAEATASGVCDGLSISTKTAVLGPGAGVITPEAVSVCAPEYEEASVLSVML